MTEIKYFRSGEDGARRAVRDVLAKLSIDERRQVGITNDWTVFCVVGRACVTASEGGFVLGCPRGNVCELVAAVVPDERRVGLASKLAHILEGQCRANRECGVERVEVNTRSERVIKLAIKMGFILEKSGRLEKRLVMKREKLE